MSDVRDWASATWRKSSYSGSNGGECIEVSSSFVGVVPVRDSKDPEGPTLVFDSVAWRCFIEGVRTGDFHSR